jgi:hypothetical protein
LAGDHGLLSIESSYDPSLADKLVAAKQDLYRFRSNHFEALLNQSNELLERVLKDRASYDTLREKAVRLVFELLESHWNIAAFDSTTEASTRQLPMDISDLNQKGLSSEIDNLSAALLQSWSRKSGHDDRWNFCLTAGTLCPPNQEIQ